MVLVNALLVACYPVIAHVAIVYGWPRLAIGYLFFLIALQLLQPSHRLSTITRTAFIIAMGVILFVPVFANINQYLVYLPPVVIPAWLLFVFARSLRPGDTAFITRIARRIEGDAFDSRLERYTYIVTIVWTGVFFIMVLHALLLPIVANQEIWSWMAHIGNYIMIITVMMLELVIRRLRFPDSVGVARFLRTMVCSRWYADERGGE